MRLVDEVIEIDSIPCQQVIDFGSKGMRPKKSKMLRVLFVKVKNTPNFLHAYSPVYAANDKVYGMLVHDGAVRNPEDMIFYRIEELEFFIKKNDNIA